MGNTVVGSIVVGYTTVLVEPVVVKNREVAKNKLGLSVIQETEFMLVKYNHAVRKTLLGTGT